MKPVLGCQKKILVGDLYLLRPKRASGMILYTNIYYFYIFFCSAVIGEIDDEIDSGIEMTDMKAEPFNPVVY